MTHHTRRNRQTLATAAGAALVVAVLGGGLVIVVALIAHSETRDITLGWLAGYFAVAFLLDVSTASLGDRRGIRRGHTLIAALSLGAGLTITDSFIAHSGLLFGCGTAIAMAATAVLSARHRPWIRPRR
jgi:hypothetical protein